MGNLHSQGPSQIKLITYVAWVEDSITLIHIRVGPFIADSGLPFLKDSFCQTWELFTEILGKTCKAVVNPIPKTKVIKMFS